MLDEDPAVSKMIRVTQLFRYPVKSFSPQSVDELTTENGRLVGDRVFAFRLTNRGDLNDWSWQRKHNYVALANTPGVAKLEVAFDEQERTLSIVERESGSTVGVAHVDDPDQRVSLAGAVEEFVRNLDINSISGDPESTPLVLVGDGRHSVFHDSEDGGVTLYGEESIRGLSDHMEADVDGLRFRANVVIEGAGAFEEISWTGELTIGSVRFNAVKPVVRCLATHTNPESGERDLDVMTALQTANGITPPTFSLWLEPVEKDQTSTIRVGDEVKLLSK